MAHSKMRQILLFISLLLFSCISEDKKTPQKSIIKQGTKHEIQTTKAVKQVQSNKAVRVKAMTNEVQEDDTVEAIITDIHYTLYPHGKVAVRPLDSNLTDTFQLNTELLIDRAYFFNYKDKLIIYYSDTDMLTGASFIECYDRTNYKMIWKSDINGFNLTEPIIVGNITYVAAIGFIGKLNLDNGQYQWKHDGLYDSTRFNSFSTIEINRDEVHFIETIYVGETRKPGRIIVDDKTGEIKQIIKNAPDIEV